MPSINLRNSFHTIIISSEMNIIVGVENEDFETAIKAIYEAFVEKPQE